MPADKCSFALYEYLRQNPTSLWVAERKASHPTQPKINSMQKYGEVDDALIDLGSRYQYVIVDAAGHDSSELRSAMTVCDVLLMPFRPSQPDLATLPAMSLLIKASKRVNPKMEIFAFVNSAPTNTQDKDSDCAREAISGCSDITLLSSTVYDRRIYRDGMAEGLAVIEMSDKSSSAMAAKSEMKKILSETLDEAF